MRRKQLSRRLIIGLVMAGLIAVGLLPLPASAADGPNLALGKSASASGSTAPSRRQRHRRQPDVLLGGAGRRVPAVGPGRPRRERGDRPGGAQAAADLGGPQPRPSACRAAPTGPASAPLSASAGAVVRPGRGQHRHHRLHRARTVRYVRVAHHRQHAAGPPRSCPSWRSTARGRRRPRRPGTRRPARTSPAASRSRRRRRSSAFVAANANDGSLDHLLGGRGGYPQTLTVQLGANADVTAVVRQAQPGPGVGHPDPEHPGARPRPGGDRLHLPGARADLPVRPGGNRTR